MKVNQVGTFFVSTLGTNATAAVGVNSSLERTITLAGSLIGSGACSYISRLLGEKKDDDADRVLSTSFFRSAFAVVSTIIINHVAGGFSTVALAALYVSNRVMEFPFVIILGFGLGYQPVVGYNGEQER